VGHRTGVKRRWSRNIDAVMCLHISALALNAMAPAKQPMVMMGLRLLFWLAGNRGGCCLVSKRGRDR